MSVLERAKGVFALPPPEDEAETEEDLQLTIIEHLQELRDRLIKSVIALGVALIPGFIATQYVFDALLRLKPETTEIIFIEPTAMFFTYFKVALFTGAALAMPVLAWQFIAFVAPALTRREKALGLRVLPFIILMFSLGIAFGYLFTVPFALRYLLTFGTEIAKATIAVDKYVSFVVTFLFAMGISFETPVVILVLSWIGVVNTRRLVLWRKYAILLIFVAAAIITPTPDPLNQALVGVPLFLLYELGILLSRLVPERKRAS